MTKLLPGLILSASLAFATVAHAQTTSPSTPNNGTSSGTSTTRPSMPMPMPMPMPGMQGEAKDSSHVVTAGELAAIGAGVVVGAVFFQGAMWHGMTIMGAALGGWVGDHIYATHWGAQKSGT